MWMRHTRIPLALSQVEPLHKRQEIGGEVPASVGPEAGIGWKG